MTEVGGDVDTVAAAVVAPHGERRYEFRRRSQGKIIVINFSSTSDIAQRREIAVGGVSGFGRS
jgi:hypothetical protein